MEQVILHIEDEENDVLLFQVALSQAGVGTPVQVVNDGQQALNYFLGKGQFSNREAFPLPALVLLDLKLPLLPGLEVLKWIRQRANLPVPVIVLSSSENEADIAAAYRLGANAYLAKPTSIEKLVKTAQGIKDFWLNLNRLPAETPSVKLGTAVG